MHWREQSAIEIAQSIRETDLDSLLDAASHESAFAAFCEVMEKVEHLDVATCTYPGREQTAREIEQLRYHLRAVAGVEFDGNAALQHAARCIECVDALVWALRRASRSASAHED